VNGIVKLRIAGDEVVIRPQDDDFVEYEIVIHNIDPHSSITTTGTYIDAGSEIGRAASSRCTPNFIHVAMRKAQGHGQGQGQGQEVDDGDYDYVDPSAYLDRFGPFPMWIEECNDHYFKHLGHVFESGGIVDGIQHLVKALENRDDSAQTALDEMDPLDEPLFTVESPELTIAVDLQIPSNIMSQFGSLGGFDEIESVSYTYILS
jgi:hypothetical protein